MFDIEYPLETQKLFGVAYDNYATIGLVGTLEIIDKIKKGELKTKKEILEYINTNYEVE